MSRPTPGNSAFAPTQGVLPTSLKMQASMNSWQRNRLRFGKVVKRSAGDLGPMTTRSASMADFPNMKHEQRSGPQHHLDA